MAAARPTASNLTSRPTYSCIRCSERKVKCDRKRPCGACVRHSVDCVFNPAQPPRNRHKRSNNQILTDRLRYYENLLREKGIDPSRLPDTTEPEPYRRPDPTVGGATKEAQQRTPSSIESDSRQFTNDSQVIHGQGRFKSIDNVLWKRMVEEFHDPEDALGDSSNDLSDPKTSDDEPSFVFRSGPESDTRPRHPSPDLIHVLWQTFVNNVDPLTKVLHVPTVNVAIEKASTNIATIPRSLEALMFAIYSAAIMSLDDEECQKKFFTSRKALLSRYIPDTETALSRARFLGTTSLVVLQALVVHLLSVRDIYEPRVVWSLTGVAVRVAESMGLERDGELLSLPPFETEMRRRIWWCLKTHDFRTAELCGIAKFRDLRTGPECTKWPVNVNDNDLYPGMHSLAKCSNSLTDAVFLSVKSELFNFAANRIASFRREGMMPSQWELHSSETQMAEKDKLSREVEQTLENKYLRYCDPSQPLHLMSMLMARCAVNTIRFLSHHPRRWSSVEQIPDSEAKFLWKLSIKLLEQENMLQSNPQLKQFAWHASYFQQWHAFIHVLDTLRANPFIEDSEKAWRLIKNTYENIPEMHTDMRKPIHIAVGNLCLKAYSKRDATLQNSDVRLSPVPPFIVHLRERPEALESKRKAREDKPTLTSTKDRETKENNSSPRLNTSMMNTGHISDSTSNQEKTTPQASDFTQIDCHPVVSEADAYWFTTGFDGNQINDGNNDLSTELDSILDQAYFMEENVIDWDQWDHWLAGSSLIGSFSSAESSRERDV